MEFSGIPKGKRRYRTGLVLAVSGILAAATGIFPALAESPAPPPAPAPVVSYSDLADLGDSSGLVLRAQVRKVSVIDPARARGVRPGYARFLIEARTQALLFGSGAMGESLRYLADLRLDAKGKPPKLRKAVVLLFANAVPGRPGELQLVAPDAQVPWDAVSEGKLRAVLGELHGPAVPPRIKGVREAIHVSGTLAGEGETQLFLDTADDSATAITVTRIPGRAPAWSVSFSEVAGAGSPPPMRETLSWYRLACFLPAELPRAVNLSDGRAERFMAEEDYRLVRRELGECGRLRN